MHACGYQWYAALVLRSVLHVANKTSTSVNGLLTHHCLRRNHTSWGGGAALVVVLFNFKKNACESHVSRLVRRFMYLRNFWLYNFGEAKDSRDGRNRGKYDLTTMMRLRINQTSPCDLMCKLICTLTFWSFLSFFQSFE